jgi:hypothetical protein
LDLKNGNQVFNIEIVRYEKVRYSYFLEIEAKDSEEAEAIAKETVRKINDFETEFDYDRAASETTEQYRADVGCILNSKMEQA